MIEKLIGEDIDISQHKILLKNFTNFIASYSTLLDSVETYHQNLISSNLISKDRSTNEKLKVIEEISIVLSDCIPIFLKFSLLEDKLDKLNA